MLSDSSGAILDLMPATGARGSDDGIGRSRSHRGEEDQLTDLHRNIEMFSLVTKRTGHAAAPRGNDLNLVVNGQFQSLYGGGERRQSLLVAMPVKLDMAGFLVKRFARNATLVGFGRDKLINQERVLSKANRRSNQ